MQVTHINHMDTHAILGGGNAVSFEVKQDAEFFEILSSTLYSNKKLAVVREILCNAWDAHIDAGTTDKFIDVTLNTNEFTIRDYGKGIKKKDMAKIYCVYGGSSKRSDDKSTGGFGLGSKSPFAYTKNFSVTTHADGFKTIFNISRGTSATGGIPDLREMVSVPTKETGVQVTIPIVESDLEDFTYLVKHVAYLGGMKLRLNGKDQKYIDYSETQNPFILVNYKQMPDYLTGMSKDDQYNERTYQLKNRIFVKIGSVVYPVPTDYQNKSNLILKSLENVEFGKYDAYCIIYIAKPNTMGITPSRESLEMTDSAVQALKDLVSESNKILNDHASKKILEISKEYKTSLMETVNDLSTDYDDFHMFKHNKKEMYSYLRHNESMTYKNLKLITNLDDLSNFYNYLLYTKSFGRKLIDKDMLKDDPDGSKIWGLYLKHIKKTLGAFVYKFYMNSFNLSGSYIDRYRLNRHAAKHTEILKNLYKVKKLTDKLDDIGAIVTFKIGHYTTNKTYNEFLSSWNNKSKFNYRSCLDQVYNSVCKNDKSIITVAKSEASVKRWLSKDRKNHDYTGIRIVARTARIYKNVLEILKHFRKDYIDIAIQDEIEKAEKQSSIPIVVWSGAGEEEESYYKLRTVEQLTHYCYAPVKSYDLTKLGLSGASNLNFNHSMNNLITYLFPNTMYVTSSYEAAYAVKLGLKNVLEELAELAVEFFLDKKNLDTSLYLLRDKSGFGMSPAMRIAMNYLKPSDILEALGEETKGINPNATVPSWVHLFMDIVGRSDNPKLGHQHIMNAVQRIANSYMNYFPYEFRVVLRNDSLQNLALKFSGDNRDAISPTVKRAAFMAAIQAVILENKLGAM